MWDGALRIESKLSLSDREQALDGDILVDVGPVDPNTATDEAPIAALGFGGLLQSLKPGEGRAEFATIGENDVQGVGADADIDCGWFKFDG
jgi:hypothetical protein